MNVIYNGKLTLLFILIIFLSCVPEADIPKTPSQPVVYSDTAQAYEPAAPAGRPEPSIAPGPAVTPEPACEPIPLQIKILGDSITAGGKCTGYSPSGEKIIKGKRACEKAYCYANLLKQYFKDDKVKNWGISAFTSADILKNIPQLVEQEDNEVLLMIGVNDCWFNIEDKFEANMEAIIRYITDKGKELIIITCSPITAPKIHHLEDVVSTQKQLALKYGLQCIDVYQSFLDYCRENDVAADSLLVDGVHPNDAGQKVIYDIIVNNIDLQK